MNCKHVQELLPLYVGRDLEENRAKQIAQHVQSCAQCAGSVDEYREARQLLQLFAPPPFSEAVYDGIRRRVLREIGRESSAPSFSQLAASMFRPRIRWALATALLLAVSVSALYFIARRRPNVRNAPQQVADSNRQANPATQDEQPKPRSKDHESAVPSSSSNQNDEPRLADNERNASADRIPGSVNSSQSQRRKSRGVAADNPRSVAVNTPDTASMTSQASRENNNLTEPSAAVPASDPATAEKTLRVEMQTRDQNIRIIWFSHQPTKQDSPSKFSKGI